VARRIRSRARRTLTQSGADARAADVARHLGRALRDARNRRGATQRKTASVAGLAQSTWSKLETGDGADVTLIVWARAARSVGVDLRAYLEGATATDQPRDAMHLRAQELIVRSASVGGWRSQLERTIDLDATRSRSADVVLTRRDELALVEVHDWLSDVGDAFRSWDRRLATVERRAIAIAPPGSDASALRACGIWALRGTRANRRLVAEHRGLWRARFPGSSAAWLAALAHRDRTMPSEPALVWVSVTGDRFIAARLG
jgi:transcriptional regulator with XRE-family HTH domain